MFSSSHDIHSILRHLFVGICLIVGGLAPTWGTPAVDDDVYVPIVDLEQLTDETPCLIVAADSVEDVSLKSGLFAMTTDMNNGRMIGVCCNRDMEASVVTDVTPKMFWRLQRNKDGNYLIQANGSRNYLSAKNKDRLQLQKNVDDALVWTVSIDTKGFVRFLAPDGRYLGENLVNAKTCYFSRYADNGFAVTQLRVFVALDKLPAQGTATMQPQGTPVVLRSDAYIYGLQDDNGTMDRLFAGDCLTSEGLMANDGSLQAWSFDIVGENAFRLLSSEGKGLDYQLRSSATPGLWILREGYITTDEEPCRYLLGQQGELQLLLESDAAFRTSRPVTFTTMGAAADTLLLPSKTKVLTGSWSVAKLAGIDWTGTLGLDLSKASFPSRLQEFRHRPAIGNSLIYIAREDAAALPEECPMVVTYNDNGEATLYRGGRLYDKQPFALECEVAVSEGQLEYVRPRLNDNGWQTVCLPFQYSVPEGITAEICTDRTTDNLIFTPTATVRSGGAAIYCEMEAAEDTEPIRFRSTDCRMTPVPAAESPLCGTFDWLESDDADAVPPTYLLNATGDTFVRAAAGSRLAPFRAYIRGGETQALRICHAATDIHPTTGDARRGDTPYGYTLDGRRLTRSDARTLHPGIYIIGGKKVIRR